MVQPATDQRDTHRIASTVSCRSTTFDSGSVAQPEKTFGLEELEDQLAYALHTISPSAAQLQVHTTAPAPGQSRRVGSQTYQPHIYYRAYDGGCLCSIQPVRTPASEMPFYEGELCLLADLVDYWSKAADRRTQQRSQLDSNDFRSNSWHRYHANIDLDAHPQDYRNRRHRTAVRPTHEDATRRLFQLMGSCRRIPRPSRHENFYFIPTSLTLQLLRPSPRQDTSEAGLGLVSLQGLPIHRWVVSSQGCGQWPRLLAASWPLLVGSVHGILE
jgi:hypothetical protein